MIVGILLLKSSSLRFQHYSLYILFTMAELNEGGIAAKSQQDSVTPSLFNILVLWAFIIVLAIVSIRALHAPPPLAATAPENEFSAERALIHVREIATVPHPFGSGG